MLADHQFSNGCHAPPWQQVHGDISYLDVKPFDADKLTITANTAGYFLNKGLTQEGQVNYEREGDVYPTLVALLKAKSPQFASTIEKKVFLYILYLLYMWFDFITKLQVELHVVNSDPLQCLLHDSLTFAYVALAWAKE